MTINGRARKFIAAVFVAAMCLPAGVRAQVALQPTPPPSETAENTAWYLGGEPITFAGNIYHPAGPQVFFNRYEMIRSGFYEGVPLYTRTTLEPFSAVFVPVGGGLMQPYERRRAGDLAGTSGSTTSAFPVVTPAEQDTDRSLGFMPQAAAPPTRVATSIGDTSRELTDVTPGTNQRFRSPAPAPVGTSGSNPEAVAAPAPSPTPTAPLRSARRPQGLNGIFIEYDNRRWFNSGPAVELAASTFVKVGQYQGFPVYEQPNRRGTIYVPATADAEGLLTPYAVRR